MVVEVPNLRSRREHGEETRAIHVQRNVEHEALVACFRLHALQELDVALDARDEHTGGRVFEPELLQRAETVGIAVEGVVQGHAGGASSTPRACRNATTRSAAASGDIDVVSMRSSGFSGIS